MTKEDKIRMQYAGAIQLLCECHLQLPGDTLEAEDLRDSIQHAVDDFCRVTGWTSKTILRRIDLYPPEVPEVVPKPRFTVVGTYIDNGQRYCDDFEAPDAATAEKMAQALANREEGCDLLIAGVFPGKLTPAT